MSRQSTFYGTLIPSGHVINDKQFLTLNGAGTAPDNPIQLGLGGTIVIDVNHVVRSVRATLARITDFGRTDERDITNLLTEVSDSRYSIEGAIGGDILGFPNNPTLDYSSSQLFELTLTAVSRTRVIQQIYQFWVADGNLHSLQSSNQVVVQEDEDLVLSVIENTLELNVEAVAGALAAGSCNCVEGGTYQADATGTADASATCIGTITVRIGGPGGVELEIPINLADTDDDIAYDSASGGC